MAAQLRLGGVEGGLTLVQDDEGRLRVPAFPPHGFERRMLGRGPLDAVFLTQQLSADGGISHALAAVMAWEQAGGVVVAENGRLLREFLHAVSLVHASVRQFYVAELPDYLPWGSLADYDGKLPAVRHLRAGLEERPRGDWARRSFEHPFSGEERDRLWERRVQAMEHLALLQRMLAVLGGKYPIAMSIVPGGLNVPVTEQTLLLLRRYLAEVRGFVQAEIVEDGLLLARRYPSIRGLGRGVADFVCTGSGEDVAALEGALFPSGVLLADRLEPFAAAATESIQRAFYVIPPQGSAPGTTTAASPDKEGAYSWIKAPRYQGRPMEAGAYARLVIAYLSGARMARPEIVDELERLLDGSIRRSNTVAGRMVARLAELGTLVDRAETLLDQVDPSQPVVATDAEAFSASGEGFGLLEAPAGSLQHRMILENGRIEHYDIVSPSTWNGAPLDEEGQAGSLETALNRTPADLSDPAQQRVLARIVHSFAFSSTDAVQ